MLFGIRDALSDDLFNLRPGGIIRVNSNSPQALAQMQAQAWAQAPGGYLQNLQQAAAPLDAAALLLMQNAYRPTAPTDFRDTYRFRNLRDDAVATCERIAFWLGFFGPLARPILRRLADQLEGACDSLELLAA